MKANELMIGDWVCTEHDATPRQIDWIRTGEVGLLWNKVVTPPYLVPIPLTLEILEKNGFVEHVFCEVEYELQCEDYRIIIHLSSGYTRIYKGSYLPILNNQNYKFVHELQHALRLCGIKKEIKI